MSADVRLRTLLLAPLATLIAGCGGQVAAAVGSVDSGGVAVDSSDTAVAPVALPPIARTLTANPLFGDTVAQNLLIDPLFQFSTEFGIGRWVAESADKNAQNAAAARSRTTSDAPVGIAFPVGQIADATTSTSSFELVAVAQVPGGPGPFHVHVWLSTLDASASATLNGVKVSLISAPDESSTAIGIPATVSDIPEDTTSTRVIAGRTWHLFDGVSSGNLELAGFLTFDFQASKNTWLMQAPEVVPTKLDTSTKGAITLPSMRRLGRPGTATPFQVQAIDLYRHRRTRAVPASLARSKANRISPQFQLPISSTASTVRSVAKQE